MHRTLTDSFTHPHFLLLCFRWQWTGVRCSRGRWCLFLPTIRLWVIAPSCTSPVNAMLSLSGTCPRICLKSTCTLTPPRPTAPGTKDWDFKTTQNHWLNWGQRLAHLVSTLSHCVIHSSQYTFTVRRNIVAFATGKWWDHTHWLLEIIWLYLVSVFVKPFFNIYIIVFVLNQDYFQLS